MTRTSVVTVALAAVLGSVGACWAQDEGTPTEERPTVQRSWVDGRYVEGTAEGQTPEQGAPESAQPREMVVNAPVVKVRGGPGLYFYDVMKLTEGARVTALGEKNGWTVIVPPSSVKAMIRKSAVSSADDAAGKVTEAKARVYARDPNSSRTWAVIAELAIDSDVTITGQEGPYYVVAMPAGAKVYIKSEYLGSPAGTPGTDGATTAGIDIDDVELRPIKIDPQAEAYDEATRLLGVELAKPLAERKWADAEAALKSVSEKATSNYLKVAAEQSLATIEFQKSLQASLARLGADKKILEENLAAIRREAEQRQAARLEQARGRVTASFDFEGTLRKMRQVMAYKYRLEDEQGNFLCLLSGQASLLDPLLGRRVRVWGDKQYRPELRKYACDVQRIETVGGEVE